MDDHAIEFFTSLLNVDPTELTCGLDMANLQQWDSFAHVQIMMFLEENYGVVINEETLIKYSHFENIITLLKHKL